MTDDERIKQFEERHERLKNLSDAELKERFGSFATRLSRPSRPGSHAHLPFDRRSVLLRMGIDSQLAFGVVDRINQAGLLGKGAGHVLLKLTEKYDYDARGREPHHGEQGCSQWSF